MTYNIIIIIPIITMYYSVYKVDYRERTAPKNDPPVKDTPPPTTIVYLDGKKVCSLQFLGIAINWLASKMLCAATKELGCPKFEHPVQCSDIYLFSLSVCRGKHYFTKTH